MSDNPPKMDKIELFDWIINWTHRMCVKYGGICYEKNGLEWDWGQAITRAVYGPDWNRLMHDDPPIKVLKEAISIAKKWEAGEPPEWFKND